MCAILTCQVQPSFYQLMIVNICESRENVKTLVIPQCILITQLLTGVGAIPLEAKAAVNAATLFDRADLNRSNFQFKETITHYVLRDNINKRRQQFPKSAEDQPAEGGDVDEEDEVRKEFDQYGSHEGF